MVIDGMSRFILRDGLIAEYRESVNGGVAMAQLGVEPERMAKCFSAGPVGSRSGRKRRTIWRGRKARARRINDKKRNRENRA